MIDPIYEQILNLQKSIDSLSSLLCIRKETGLFSSETTTITQITLEIKKLLENNLNNLNSLSNSSTLSKNNSNDEIVKQIMNSTYPLSLALDDLLESQKNLTKEIKNPNSLIVKSINRVERKNTLNSIDSLFMEINKTFNEIIVNCRKKYLTIKEAVFILNNTINIIKYTLLKNKNENVITIDEYDFYSSKLAEFKENCQNFINSYNSNKESNQKENDL